MIWQHKPPPATMLSSTLARIILLGMPFFYTGNAWQGDSINRYGTFFIHKWAISPWMWSGRKSFYAVFLKMRSVWEVSHYTSADYAFLKHECENQGFLQFRACEKVKIPFFKLTFSQNCAARRIKAFPLIWCNVGSVSRSFYWFKT